MVPNRTLAGRYRLTDLLGQGGLADVYIATDLVLQREVVVKVLPPSADVDDAARFVAGARALSQLNHPAIVQVFDADVDADAPYLVMERVAGRPLCDLLAEGPLSPERAAHVGEQVAAALVHAHEHGIVHRDVKPGNVLVAAGDAARLADFGIAGLPETARVTVTGQLLESGPYVAPEQVRGDAVGPAADVYALGLLIIEAVTGRRPFPGTPIESALARLEREVVIGDDVPAPWRNGLRAMTRRDPDARPSAAAVHGWLLAPSAVALHVRTAPAPPASSAGRPAADQPAGARRHSAARSGPRRGARASRWHRSVPSITTFATAAALAAVALTGTNLEAIVRPLRDVISPPAAAVPAEPADQAPASVALSPAGEEAIERAVDRDVTVHGAPGVPREDRHARSPEARSVESRTARDDATATAEREPVRGAPVDRPDRSGSDPATDADPGATPGPGGAPGQGTTPPGATPGAGPPDAPRGPDREPPARGDPPRAEPSRAEPPRAQAPAAPPAHAPAPRSEPPRAEPARDTPVAAEKPAVQQPVRQDPERDTAPAAKAAAPDQAAPARAAAAPAAPAGPAGTGTPPGDG